MHLLTRVPSRLRCPGRSSVLLVLLLLLMIILKVIRRGPHSSEQRVLMNLLNTLCLGWAQMTGEQPFCLFLVV